jgi:hypothetical protein
LGLDHQKWVRLRDNALALVLSGKIDLLSAEHHTAKTFSDMAKRKDLAAPPQELVASMALRSFRLVDEVDLRFFQLINH